MPSLYRGALIAALLTLPIWLLIACAVLGVLV